MRFQQWAEGWCKHPSTPVTELLVCFPLGFSRVDRHWRGGINGSGSIGGALLLALELRELPVLDQEIKTRAAGVGLFVGPFVHAEFAIDEEFLALLNELAEILGRSAPYLEVHKSGDLLFLALSVGEVLVVGDGCRQNSFPARGVSEFGISGEVASDDDFVDVHKGDLGFRFDVCFLRLFS
jgi:hypothetical protein